MRRVADAFRPRRLSGFLTGEIREKGERVGFRLSTPGPRRRSLTLAHVRFSGGPRVGRYRVDLSVMEDAASALSPDTAIACMVDEIGEMECLSAVFVEAMRALLDSLCPTVATVAQRGAGFIEEV